MKKYTEYLQYSLWISDVKTKEIGDGKNGRTKYDPECIRGIWNSSGSHGIFPVGVKRCTFEDYIDLITSGHSVKRVQKIGVESFSSRFLFIDLDNDNGENVTEDELEALKLITNNRIVFYPSTSGTPFRWHLYIETANPMFVVKDLKRETFKIISELESVCKRKVTCDSKCYQNWHQVCYGMPQREHYKLSIPEGTEFFCHQILKPKDDKEPVIVQRFDTYEEFNTSKRGNCGEQESRLVPYNSKLLSRALNQPVLVDKSFSISPPSAYKKKLIGKGAEWKVRAGKRYPRAQAWMLKLVSQWYKCNLKYGMGFTIRDLEYTMRFLCKTNFEEYETFNMRGIINGLHDRVNKLKGLTYDQIEEQSKGQIRIYRERHYFEDLLAKLANEFMYDECTVMFQDREAMNEALKRYNISYRTAKRKLNKMGFDIQLMNSSKSHRGKSKIIDFDKYPQNEKGQYLIPRDEVTQQVRNRASKLKIKIKSIKKNTLKRTSEVTEQSE